MVGGKPVPELTRMLELEGVRTTVVLTKDPDAYRGAELAGNARGEVIEREDAVLRELAATRGVTVLIHDGICANERAGGGEARAASDVEPLRRDQRGGLKGRGTAGAHELHVAPPGGNGALAQVHASSCNQDLSVSAGLPVRDGRRHVPGRATAGPRPRSRPTPSRSRPTASGSSGRAATSFPGRGDRGDHAERAAQLGGADRRPARPELRSNRGGPRSGRLLQPDPRPTGARGGREQGRARPGRPLPGARPPGGRDPRQPQRCDPARTVAVVVGPAERRDGTERGLHAARRRDPRPDRPLRRGDANVAVDARQLSELSGDDMAT